MYLAGLVVLEVSMVAQERDTDIVGQHTEIVTGSINGKNDKGQLISVVWEKCQVPILVFELLQPKDSK